MANREKLLDELANYNEWTGLSRDRLIPLLEASAFAQVLRGEQLFEQFHPADRFFLLADGTAIHSGTTASRQDRVPFGPVDWRFAALGWSGFLSPQRYGTSVVAGSRAELLMWSHEELARLFYADPELAVRFFDLVLGSVSRQLTELRRSRVEESGLYVEAPEREALRNRRPVVGSAENVFRRSAFFAAFDEDTIAKLAATAEMQSFAPGERIVTQDEAVDGLLVIASGRCSVCFEKGTGDAARLVPFRRVHDRVGIIAGIPAGGRFRAEATVIAESHCWLYRLPAATLDRAIDADPEFGRMFQQRMLARLAGLIGAVRIVHAAGTPDAEVNAVGSMIANSQTRLPVTSELHKVPHLLQNRLTVGNAFAVLHKVAATGRYHERALASQCTEVIAGLAAEHAFYQDILATCDAVMFADESMPAHAIRSLCDEHVGEAFANLDCRVLGTDRLPASGGNVFILNHLACPEYYELPNYYHFSFDTAFVSWIVWRHFGQSAVRVVRESPGAEFGHGLFYERLQHITVPTPESGLDGLGEEAFAELRRAAARAFEREGRRVLAKGGNLIICPEGQSQPVERSPARFHSGAFRLALATGARIVPVALAGFHRRFKDGPLVASIGEPFRVPEALRQVQRSELRRFVDAVRDDFADRVAEAGVIAAEPARLPRRDRR